MAQVSYGQMTIADLTDNYQVQLSPESASFAGGTSSAKDGNITVIVSTLQGNKRIAHTIGTPTGLPTGMTVTNKVNGTATADGSFKVNVTTTLTSTSGYFTIPITVSGVTYNRRFSYSVGREGSSVTITNKTVTYQVGTSGTSAPTGTWQTTVQSPAENQFLWTKTEVTYSDGNKTVAYSVSRNAQDGVSPTATKTQTEYQQSTNGTTPPTGTWLTSAPDAIAGQYMWTRITVTYSDTKTSVSYSVSRNGADGERGTGFYSVTTAPSEYTTKVSTFTPSYRIALSTVKSQAGVSEVLVGDVIQQGYNTYPVGYVDSNYVYLGAANSIRGQAGAAGLHSAQVVLYQRGTTAPSKPSGDVTYTFATGKATNNLGSWSQTIPSGTNPVYMIAASASSTEATDTIPSSEWSTPVKILEDGTDGYNQATIFLYQRAASAPSKPTATPTYTFSTGALSANPSGWSRTIPANNGSPCYVTTAVAISKTGTATVSGWSDVSKLAEDGVSVTSVNSSKSGDTTTVTITLSDGTSKQFTVKDGATGDTGATAQWYYGTDLTHTSDTATLAISKTSGVVVGSMYLNPDTSLCYRCTAVSGSNATWTYAGDLTTGVINNIEIGGRNLIRNGDFSNSTTYWVKEGSTSYSVVTDTRFGHALSVVFSAAGSASNRVYQNITDKPITHVNGESRAIQFWAKASTATTITVGRAGTAQLYLSAKPVSTAWQKYEANIVANGTGSLTFFAGTACTLYLTNIMLVSGNIPMDWSPAPEDTEAAITALDESFDQEKVFNRLTNNQANQGIYLDNGNVYVNATYIKSGTVAADRIKASVITAVNSSTETSDGSSLKISADKVNIEGAAIFTNDGRLSETSLNNAYDSKGSAASVQTNLTTEINQRKAQYGTSSTAAGTADKVVTCANFELVAGNEITVKFSTANTSSGLIRLNVNSKGVKNVWVANAVTSSTNQLLWGANAYITFRYDGTQFIVIGEPRTWYGASTTAAATAAKTDTTAVTGCVICKGAKIELAMSNNNTNTSATLNIRSTGAKAIYYGNTTTRPTVDNGHSWLGASTATFTFDGQFYRMAGQTVISGDSITTGTIDANRINASELKIGSSTLGTELEQLNNIEVGGRNLLINTELMSSWDLGSGASIVDEGSVSIYGSASDWNARIFTNKFDASMFDGITTYIFSMEYKLDINCSVLLTINGSTSDVSDDAWIRTKYANWTPAITLPQTDGTWIKYSFPARTITVSDLTSGSGDVITGFLGLYARTNSTTLQVRHIKLEKGNKATDWSPAPEDTEAAIDTVKTDFSFANETMSSLIQKANDDNSKLIEQLSKIDQTLNEIKLSVFSVANNKAFLAGTDISSYVTEEVPTLMNYPAFTDFFIWKACATSVLCSESLICGTNNYAAYENAVAHCTADDTYYIFEKDSAGEYDWRAMTYDEYVEKSNKYSMINIEDNQITISSALNNALTELLINSTGVTASAGKMFCC